MKGVALVRVLAPAVAFVLVAPGAPLAPVAALSEGGPFVVDVLTNRGGVGPGVSGGSYEVGEEVTLYWEATSDCFGSVTIYGPTTGYPGQLLDAVLEAGMTYEWSLGVMEEADMGQWEVSIDACTDQGQCDSDSTSFTVVAAQPPATPLAVDVWTSKGGTGPSVAGGTYEVGDETSIYLRASEDCEGSLVVEGPTTGYPGRVTDVVLVGGRTYKLAMGRAEETDVGQWEAAIDACTDGGQCASDSTSFRVIASEPPLSADVWTDRGGRGADVDGGTYEVGEEVTLYLRVTARCRARWTLTGPPGTTTDEQRLNPGVYDLGLARAEEEDIGWWQVVLEASSDGQRASDVTSFTIVAAETEDSTSEIRPAPEGEERLTPKVDETTATELYALMALKMSQGSLEVDLNLDADGDGQVTAEDARLILTWAVGRT